MNEANTRHEASLFDFQVNGFGGIDFQRPDTGPTELRLATDALIKHGTSGILLTLITDTIDNLCSKLENFESIRRGDPEIARVVRGYHIEGPWISDEPGYHGAHSVHLVSKPTMADYRRLLEAAGGGIRLITLAPEVDGALEVIEQASRDGIRTSLGHTNATEHDIEEAISAGATLVTHLGNAVPAVMQRHDNVVQRLLARDELIACMIPDGLHLPPFVLKNYFRAKPAGKVFFTTDCMAAAGASAGCYTIGPHEIVVGEDGIVRLPGEQRFAGSSLTMDRAVANIQGWLGLDEDTAVRMCSDLPATHFGITL